MLCININISDRSLSHGVINKSVRIEERLTEREREMKIRLRQILDQGGDAYKK